MPALLNLPSLIDDARCFELVRQHRWPDGVRCPRCGGAAIARDGRDDVQPHRQRYRCARCGARFDDLSGTVLAGRHRPLRLWVLCLYLMGLNLSNRQIARELDLAVSDVQAMTEVLRHGLTAKLPSTRLEGAVEIDEIYVVAGHLPFATRVLDRDQFLDQGFEHGLPSVGKGRALAGQPARIE